MDVKVREVCEKAEKDVSIQSLIRYIFRFLSLSSTNSVHSILTLRVASLASSRLPLCICLLGSHFHPNPRPPQSNIHLMEAFIFLIITGLHYERCGRWPFSSHSSRHYPHDAARRFAVLCIVLYPSLVKLVALSCCKRPGRDPRLRIFHYHYSCHFRIMQCVIRY